MARCVSQLGHQAEAAALGSQARYFRCRIVEVAEEPGMRGTGEHARRLALLGRQQHVVDAIDAKRALLHRTRRGVELARTVGTRPRAKIAPHALVLIDEHDAVVTLVRCTGRADGHTVRVGAVHAGHREIDGLACRVFAKLVMPHAIEPDTGRLSAEGLVIGKRPAYWRRSVPFLARGRAGVTAHTGVEIDDEAESHAAGSV